MSDEHSSRPAGTGGDEPAGGSDDDRDADNDGTDDDSDAGSLEPGGGPRRVVSDQSVDDILASLESTKGASADEPDPSSNESSSSSARDGSADGESIGGEIGRDSSRDSSSVLDPDASAVERSPGDDLEARIERGQVTGADVRAAEAGDGRESTPDIDEIDLSMDDLEATDAGDGATEGTDAIAPSDATTDDEPGMTPSSDSVERPDDERTTAGRADEKHAPGRESDERTGLFGRLLRLFSR
ncbi:hypothetical protein [Natrarchaeobius oligotrophus]|uniref:hypothetical protein n=1 Tax=Natrarchaeobius oligotrophus TaxID=3455743 RepID=UPI001A9EA483|nr:hypothetical protein [Natrarchaeobius chitinivorans]